MRSKSKMINYGIVYGLSDFGLADRLNIPREEAKQFIDAYLERFPRVAQFMQDTIERAKEEGHVTTLWGRRRQIPELRARNYQVRSQGERLAVNTVIQGTAADVIKLAMVRCDRALARERLRTRLILTIHDELLFEGPPDEVPVGARADRARDGRRVGARPADGRGRRRGTELAGGQVSRGLAVLLTTGAGVLVGMQAPINARLGRAVGSLQAATVSFVVGTVALVAIAAVAGGGFATLSNAGRAPWWAFVGGLLGATYVTVAILTVRTLGASGLTAAVITGQLAISVAIDRLGLLGVVRQPLALHRIVGLVLLVLGVALVVRR